MCQWFERNRYEIRLWLRLIGLVVVVGVAALAAGFFAYRAGPVSYWPIGLGFALAVGPLACWRFLKILRRDYMRLRDRPVLGSSRGVPPSLVGVIEQLLFVVAVGAFYRHPQALAGVFAVMALWLGAKMLTGWNRTDLIVVWDQDGRDREWRRAVREQEQDERARGALSALLAGVLSLAIATVGGNIAAGGTVISGGAVVFTEAAEWILGVEDGVNPIRYYPATDIAL